MTTPINYRGFDPATLCGATFDRGPGTRQRVIGCTLTPRHEGDHFATWGASQRSSQMSWPSKAVKA